MRRVEIAVGTLVVGLAVLAPVLSAGGPIPIIVYAGLALACAGGEVVAGRRYRSWGYCERSLDLLVRRGVLIRRLTVVPYGRMQLVDVTAGAAERAFGLADDQTPHGGLLDRRPHSGLAPRRGDPVARPAGGTG